MKLFSWITTVVVCGLVAVALGVYKYNQISAAIALGESFPEPAEAVEVYIVQSMPRQASVAVTGEVVATQSATLQNELTGRIVEVGFAPGAQVRQGQVLLRLDTSQERAQLDEARADQKIARLALKRAQRLVRSGAGSVEVQDQAQAQYDGALARVSALLALIEKKTLVAPFAAVTSLHQLEVGQFLDAGTEITTLVGLSDFIWIDFTLPQDNAAIEVDSQVEILAGQISRPLNATVIARDAAVNVRSRNLKLRARLPATAAENLLPGMLVRVNVPLGEESVTLVAPPTAVRRNAMGASVYVLESVMENGVQKTRARRRAVKLANIPKADLEQDLVLITEGLEVGEKIAAIGAFKLRDGVLVLPKAADPEVAKRVVGR